MSDRTGGRAKRARPKSAHGKAAQPKSTLGKAARRKAPHAKTPKTPRTRQPSAPPHPHSVPILGDGASESGPDLPFAEGRDDTLDPNLRYRMVSEAAFHRLEARGFADGNEVEDWDEAEDSVEHVVDNPRPDGEAR